MLRSVNMKMNMGKSDINEEIEKIIQASDTRILAVADSTMRIVYHDGMFKLPKRTSLLEIVTGDCEKLFTLRKGETSLLGIYIGCKKLEVEATLRNGFYIVTRPRSYGLSFERAEELRSMTCPEVLEKLPPELRRCITAYREVLRCSGRKDGGTGDASKLIRKVTAIADEVRGVLSKSCAVARPHGIPIVRYSEKDFCRILLTMLSACDIMAGRECVKTRCETTERFVSLTATFAYKLSEAVAGAVVSGEFESMPFIGEYGGLFMMLSYLQRLCRIYEYSFAAEKISSRSMTATLLFPITVERDRLLDMRENDEWIREIASCVFCIQRRSPDPQK